MIGEWSASKILARLPFSTTIPVSGSNKQRHSRQRASAFGSISPSGILSASSTVLSGMTLPLQYKQRIALNRSVRSLAAGVSTSSTPSSICSICSCCRNFIVRGYRMELRSKDQ